MSIGEGWELPADAAPWSDFHWFRVGGKTALNVVVLSEKPLWYVGHFHKGRMVPCYGDGCVLCQDGVGRQVRYVLGVVEVTSQRVGLLEVGKQVGELIRDWMPRTGALRGMWLDLFKHSFSKNSRMEVTYVDKPIDRRFLTFQCPDIRKALESTWRKAGVPIPDGYVSIPRFAVPEGEARKGS